MHRPLLLRRWFSRALLAVLVLDPRQLWSQAPLVEHPMVFDMKIALPAGWASDSIPGLQALVERFYDGSQPLTEERVQSLAADFQRTPLLRARNPERLTDQAIVVFTLIPGFHVREFEARAQDMSESLVASHCDASRGVVERAGGTMSCDRYELRQVDGRQAVVVFGAVRVDANGIDNRRTVVLMPVDGGLLSFTLSVRRTEPDTSLEQRVISSIRAPQAASQPQTRLPEPALVFAGASDFVREGLRGTTYLLSIANFAAFPDSLFVPAPTLPPCGTNTLASRTWLRIYDTRGREVYGYCGLMRNAGLREFSFDRLEGFLVPDSVYVMLADRMTGATYRSNLVAIVRPDTGAGTAPAPRVRLGMATVPRGVLAACDSAAAGASRILTGARGRVKADTVFREHFTKTTRRGCHVRVSGRRTGGYLTGTETIRDRHPWPGWVTVPTFHANGADGNSFALWRPGVLCVFLVVYNVPGSDAEPTVMPDEELTVTCARDRPEDERAALGRNPDLGAATP